jgi:hypothetical protein
MNSDDIAVGILKAATVIAIVAGITWLFYSERPWLAVLLGAVALVWPALWSQLQEGDVAGFVQTGLAIAFLAGIGRRRVGHLLIHDRRKFSGSGPAVLDGGIMAAISGAISRLLKRRH